jgi:hypothetical protein
MVKGEVLIGFGILVGFYSAILAFLTDGKRKR